MSRYRWLIAVFITISCFISKAQKPIMPTFNYLTINLATGNPTLYWTPPAFDPLHPNPSGYIIYKTIYDILSPTGRNVPIDTVGPTIKNYTDFTSNGNNEKLSYLISSYGVPESSQLTSRHSSIFITSVYDSCNHKIDLTWNNYEGWGNHIKYYRIYIGNTSNFATFTLYATIPGAKNTASITNINENQDYYLYIQARKDTTGIGGIPYISKSNLFHKYTKMPIHPASMTIDSILADDQKTDIYFKIDTTTELNKFQIVRWESSDSVKSLYSKITLYTFSDPHLNYYAVTSDNWAARTRPFYYKVDALNTCGRIVKVTNHSNSITPKVHNHGLINTISWDPLYVDTAITSRKNNYTRYRVIRYAYTDVALPPTYLPETQAISLEDDVHGFEGQGYSIKFCYQIEGFERDISGQTVMLSRSRIQCTEIVPGLTMPDAIIPTSNFSNNGNSRNLLVPIITFKANYTLSIYSRWGDLIFCGENEGWNGRLTNGDLAKEGTYIYKIVVHTTGNRDVAKTGNVSVIYK